MKINVELAVLEKAIDAVMKIAPPVTGNLDFKVEKKTMTVATVSDLSRCRVVIPCEVDKDGEFAIPAQALRDSVKGRAQIELSYANSTLTVKSGKYKTELSTVDVVPQDEVETKASKAWKVDPETSDWLVKALRTVYLKPTALLTPWMPVAVSLTAKGAFVCCYDTRHMNWVTSKEVVGDFEVALPIDTLVTICDVFSATKFTINVSDSALLVRSKLAEAWISLPDMQDLPGSEMVRAKIKSVAAEKGKALVMDKAEVQAFIDNARAVVSKERAELLVSQGDKGTVLEVKTGMGTSKAIVASQGKAKMKVDLEYLQELISKAPAKLEISVVDTAFLSMQLSASKALLALNQ